MTDTYEFSEFQRESLVYDFVTLLPEEREQKKKNFEEFQAKKEAEKIAATKKAAEEKAAALAKPVEPKQDSNEENKQ
jgi:hypothetical protein